MLEEGAHHAAIEVGPAGRRPDEGARRRAAALRVADGAEQRRRGGDRAPVPEACEKTATIEWPHTLRFPRARAYDKKGSPEAALLVASHNSAGRR